MNNASPNLPKVLYIMGTARSGSTILEILLSKGIGVFGAGELTSLIQDGFIENKQCSCGASCTDCDIWGKVSEHLKLDKQELEEWAALQKKMDWHDGLFKQLFSVMPRKDIFRYWELNTRLLTAIQEVTGCKIVLDSSKYAGRALALLRVVNADVRVICLTRSPAGLMQSFQKQNKGEQQPKSLLATLLYYLVTLTSLRAVSFKLKQRILYVNYDEFVKYPDDFIREIQCFGQVDLIETQNRLSKGIAFPVGHLITANRLRKRGSVQFSPEIAANHQLSIFEKLILKLMCLWKKFLRF